MMKEITYGDLLNCYNTLLVYAGRQYLHFLDAERNVEVLQSARDDDETETPANIDAAIKNANFAAELVRQKLEAAQKIMADFYFDGYMEDAQSATQAMAEYLDCQDKAAEALTLCAPPEGNPGEVIVW